MRRLIRAHAPRRERRERTKWTEIIEPGRAGDKRALAALYEVYRSTIYCYARARGFPPERARDLTHEIFVVLLSPKGLSTVRRDRGRFPRTPSGR